MLTRTSEEKKHARRNAHMIQQQYSLFISINSSNDTEKTKYRRNNDHINQSINQYHVYQYINMSIYQLNTQTHKQLGKHTYDMIGHDYVRSFM